MVICSNCGAQVEKYANRSKCRECYNSYMREYMIRRYHEKRASYIKEFGGICCVCGSDELLEFDHEDPSQKSFTISGSFWSKSEAAIRAELAKCSLKCRKCHQEKSTAENRVRVLHCCGREFIGVQRYRGHKRWCRV